MKDLLLKLDLQFFADEPTQGEPTPPEPQAAESQLTLDAVQKFLAERDEGKTYLQSFADSRVTDAIKTYETKTLPKKIQAAINEQFPPESEEAKELRELRAEFEQEKQRSAQEKLMNTALKTASEYNVPSDIIDLFVRNDEETTTANMARFKEHFESAVDAKVQAEVAKRFAEASDNPPPPKGDTSHQQRLEQAREKAIRLGTAEARAEYAEIKNEKQ